MRAPVLLQVNQTRRRRNALVRSFQDGPRFANQGHDRTIMVCIALHVQQRNARPAHGLHNGLHDLRPASFAEIRHTFNQLLHDSSPFVTSQSACTRHSKSGMVIVQIERALFGAPIAVW